LTSDGDGHIARGEATFVTCSVIVVALMFDSLNFQTDTGSAEVAGGSYGKLCGVGRNCFGSMYVLPELNGLRLGPDVPSGFPGTARQRAAVRGLNGA
jgi:hypothetical protein